MMLAVCKWRSNVCEIKWRPLEEVEVRRRAPIERELASRVDH